MRYDDLSFMPIPGRDVTPEQFFEAIVYHIFTELRCAVPATVLTWTAPVPGPQPLPAVVSLRLDFKLVRSIDNATEIRPSKGETLSTESRGLRAVSERGTYQRVPIMYPGDPKMNSRGRIPTGTTGLYIVADRCIDQWLNTGGPLDPATEDKHDLNDGFFFPTVYHGANSPSIPDGVHQIGPDDGTAGLEIDDTTKDVRVFTDGPNLEVDAATLIKLGTAASLGVARLTDKTSADTSMATFITGLVTAIGQIAAVLNTAGPVVGAPGTVTPVAPPSDFGFISSASTKVQAE